MLENPFRFNIATKTGVYKMKKLSKVIFIIALLAMVILPLSAAKAMNVSWQWLLSDPDVTAYRYQLNGEVEDGWTVVDGKTDTYSATDLDPYQDYTLYLQCSYDGINWSESATSTAYALLQHEEVVAEPEPVVEPAVEPVVEEPVVSAEAKAEETTFYVYGYAIENKWVDGHFESTIGTKGLVSASDIRGFLAYEEAKYPELAKSVAATIISDGFTLDYAAGMIDEATLVSTYRADLTDYVEALLSASKTEEKAVETVTVEEVPETIEKDFTLFGYTIRNTYTGTEFVSYLDIATKGDIASFIAYENSKYSFLKENVTVKAVEDGKMVLTVPASLDLDSYVSLYKAEIIAYVEYLLSIQGGLNSTSSNLFGYTVDAEWCDGFFKSTLEEKGIVSASDVAQFAQYECAKYPYLLEVAKIEFVEDGFVLLLPQSFSISGYVPTYYAELKSYVLSLFPALENYVAPVSEAVAEEKTSTVAPLQNTVKDETTSSVQSEIKANDNKSSEETKSEETVVAEAPVEPSVPVASAPKAAKKVAESRANFLFSLGAEMGFKGLDVVTTNPTIFPRLSIGFEGQNLVKLGAFGLGLRSDVSFVFIPQDRTLKDHDFNYFVNYKNWGVDATADVKLMAYINGEGVKFYLGAGLGYSLASNTFTTAHNGVQVLGFNSAFALTGVLGFSINLGDNVALLAESYGRLFFQNPKNFGEFSVAATLGLGFKF